MALTSTQLQQLVGAAENLANDAPMERFEDFVARILGLNVMQLSQVLPSPDPLGLKAKAVAEFTKKRDDLIRIDCKIPNYVIATNAAGVTNVGGFYAYLISAPNANAILAGRLRHHNEVRQALLSIRNGHYLEAISAVIMSNLCKYGEATSGSGDQGLDSIGWNELVILDPLFSSASVPTGEKVFLFASAKASTTGALKVINPAYIRELVGGWVIQRSTSGKWKSQGIQTLSAVQMILVTTYRLSTDARGLCLDLGIQVWGITELIYLISTSAPDSVFDPLNNYSFSPQAFRAWWLVKHQNRVAPI